MNLKLFETKKLHYGKYLYKVVMYNSLAPIFRMEFQKENFSYARSKLDECNIAYMEAFKKDPMVTHFILPWQRYYQETVRIDQYFDAINLFRLLKTETDYKIRVEQATLIVYTNDRNFVKSLINNLKTVVEFWEPDPENIETLVNNKNIILVAKEPKYKYKLTFGKLKGVPALAKWIESNPSLAKAGDSTINSLYNEGYVKGLYFYVRDNKALTLAQLMVGNNIQRIDELLYNAT